MAETILEVKNLVTSFRSNGLEYPAVDGISFSIEKGEIVGLVGESGCGKSVTSLSILQLIDPQAGRISSGQIFFRGQELLTLNAREMQAIRGNKISMIFQEPMTSLNPVFTIGDQIGEVFSVHQNMTKRDARRKTVEMLRLVNIPAPEKRIDEYPHQLSGGMRQRVMIAMSLACHPELLIADEPTTALDVTIQAQILDILRKLKNEMGMSILLITHDLGIVAEFCDRVIVMYAGKVVEAAPVETLLSAPKHPYTQGLIASIPRLDVKREILPTIPGMVPPLENRVKACQFSDRCSHVMPRCTREVPPLSVMSGKNSVQQHIVSCFLYEDHMLSDRESKQ